MATKHKDLTDDNELHNPKGFSSASANHGLIKNDVGELEWVPVSELGGAEGPAGSLQSIAVSDIDNTKPELNAANLATYGRFLYCVENVTVQGDAVTFYRYDDSNTQPENSPYILNTLDGGNTRWVAVGGKYSINPTQNVDGSRDITSAEISKLGGIESGATGDQTGAEIKAAYEAESNTNAFTDAEKTKLGTVQSGATDDQTGAEIKAAYEGESNTNAFTDAEKTKLGNIESGATADQTDAEIKTAYENNSNTNAFTDAEKTQLSNTESSTELDARDVANRARTNHTGTQTASTISDFDTAVASYLDRSSDTSSAEQLNNTTTMVDRFNIAKTPVHTATYYIEVDFIYSMNDITVSFEGQLLLDGVIVDRIMVETKDAGGTEGSSGTDQRLNGRLSGFFSATASTDFDIQFQFRTDGVGGNAAIKNHVMKVERYV